MKSARATVPNLQGHASSTLHSIRVTIGKVLHTAVESGYLEGNPAHGIQIGAGEPKKRRRVLEPEQMQELLRKLPEPCRSVVLTAVLAGLRIGEILALRWNRLDFRRGSMEVSETYSDGRGLGPQRREVASE